MGIVDRYKDYKEDELKKLSQDDLAALAFQALQMARLLDQYTKQNKKTIGMKLYKPIDDKFKPHVTLFELCEISNDQSFVSNLLTGKDRARALTADEILRLCPYIRTNPYDIIFPENARGGTSYIPYDLLPTRCVDRYRIYSNLRASARKEIYILGVGFSKTTLEETWKDMRKNVKCKFLAYDIDQYEQKEDADVKYFDDLMCEEQYVQTCRASRGVMDDYQGKMRRETVDKIIDIHKKTKKKTETKENKIEAIDLRTEFRYYDIFLPINLTLIDPLESEGEALFEVILPFTKMTYKEMRYGDEDEKEAWPRPIFHVTKSDDPIFFQAITIFMSAMWEKAGKKWNAQREIAKELIKAEGFDDDAVIAAYTGLTADEVKTLRTRIK